MGKETLYTIKNKSLFEPSDKAGRKAYDRIELSVALPNVNSVLPNAEGDLQDMILAHYGLRGGSMDWTRKKNGLAVPAVDKRILDHAAYLAAIVGKPFNAYSHKDLQNGSHPADTLIVPYAPTHDAKKLIADLGQESWGLPTQMVEKLINKASFHELVRDSKVPGVEVPDFKITDLKDFVGTGKAILKESQALYEKHEDKLPGKYPLGLMIRPDRADGQYGSSKVVEREDGSILVTMYGKETIKKVFEKGNWDAALQQAKNGLSDNMKPGLNPQIVVSRFVDVADSPGLTMVVKDGHTFSLGWNGQIMEKGDTNCVGTTSYKPESPYLQQMQKRYEEKSVEIAGDFIRETAKGLKIPVNEVDGVLNFDIMLPGPLEVALRKARHQGSTGQGEGIYLAESNARWTNFSDGVMAGIGVKGLKPSIASMKEVVRYGITNLDKYPVPEHVRPEDVRQAVFDRDQRLKDEGDARVIVRMPDIPMGVILLGNAEKAKKELDGAIADVSGGVVFERKKVKAGSRK